MNHEAHAAQNAAAYRPSITQHEADLISLAQRVRELERQRERQAEVTLFLCLLVLVLTLIEVFQ